MKRRSTAALILIATTCGCAEFRLKQKERQMQFVARDWSMTIRASQVVPVFPLTQDIQPGDVFLVNQTVVEQSRRFRDRGFMPTDLRIARMHPTSYREAYGSMVREKPSSAAANVTGTKDPKLVLPADWRDGPKPNGPWSRFPKVGFPSYSFKVSNAGGLSMAVPLQAVPVALSVTGAASATGSVTMSDAVTYGIDATTLYDMLVELKKQRALDQARPPAKQGPWYLRVVTRVFAAKKFSVVLSAESTMGGGVDAGAAQPVTDAGGKLPGGQTIEVINKQLEALQKPAGAATSGLPGGSLRATFASSRTVGFEESFDEPLVVGYHGFDVAIDSDGNLGSIIPTFEVLNESISPPTPTAVTASDSAYMALIQLLRDTSKDKAGGILELASSRDPDLRAAYERRRKEKADEHPVEAWVSVTKPLFESSAGQRRLLDILSHAVREAGD